MTHTKKLISIMLIAVLMLSIVPFGATEQVETSAPVEQAAPTEAPPVSTEVPAPTEAPPAPVATEAPTEEPAPTEQTPTEEPTTAPTEQPTQEPLPSPTEQANVVDKTGWENAPQGFNYNADTIGLGNSFQICIWGDGGTGKYTFAYYVYKGNTVVQKTAYSKNVNYMYTPKTTGLYHVVVFVKNEKGEIRTLTSKYKVNVIEKHIPIYARIIYYNGNIVLGDAIGFEIESWYGSDPHMHTYYVYNNDKLIEKLPYKQGERIDFNGYPYETRPIYNTKVSYKPKSPGKYKFVIFAKDASGNIKMCTSNEFLVKSATLNLRANVKNKVERVNEVANITAEANGGSGTYQYAYYVYKDNAIIEKVGYTSNAEFNYVPKSIGTYKVLAFVKDSQGAIKTDTTQEFAVTIAPLDIQHTERSSDNRGIICLTFPEGGVAPYTYAYYIYKDNTLIEKLLPYTYGKGDSIEGFYDELYYKPKNQGEYTIQAFVKDAAGTIKTETLPAIAYNGGSLEMKWNPTIEDNIYLGNVINVEAYASQGEGFYQYAYYIYKDNNLLQKFPYTNNYKLAYKPKSTGVYKVLAFVKDDSGKIVYGMSNECAVKAALDLKIEYISLPEVSLPKKQINVRVYADGGIQPYQYAYYIYHNNKIIKKTAYIEGNVDSPYGFRGYNFIATNVGNYHVAVFLKDATGKIVMKRSGICVVSNNPQPTNYEEISINTNFYKYTSSFRVKYSISRGESPYQYAYYIYKDGIRIKTTPYSTNYHDKNVYYNVTESGTYKVIFFVKDNIGKIKTHIVDNIVFNLHNEPNIIDINFKKDSTYLGNPLEVRTIVNYGHGSNIAYNVFKDGKLYYKSNFMPYYAMDGDIQPWSFKPAHKGSYKVEAIVRSPSGATVSAITPFYCEIN